MPVRILLWCLFIGLTACSGVSLAGVFDLEEIQVTPSPHEERYLEIKQSEKVLDFDVAKDGPRAAVLIREAKGAKVVFWDMNRPEELRQWPVPKGFGPRAITWHPVGKSLFLAGKQGNENVILRVDHEGGESWKTKTIYRSAREIRRLAPAPRPFVTETDFIEDEVRTRKAYRIFFGLRNPDGSYAIKSVTEDGEREYQAIGSRKGFTTFEEGDVAPSTIEAASALPLAFHPAGHLLLWEDEKRSFHYALYDRDHWETSTGLSYPGVSGGTLTPTPNGLGLIHWQPGSAGVTLVMERGRMRQPAAAGYTFLSTPSSVPDGRGIAGLVKKDKGVRLVYVPIQVPLADVANAWMFAGEHADRELLSSKGGLLRDLPDDQLYSMYESEAYQCGGYDQSTPTRPYLVTTDVFWEIFAAAYEGLFIIQEKQQAIPAFWKFVEEAEKNLLQTMPDSRWMHVFSVVAAMKKGTGADEAEKGELARIAKEAGREISPLLNMEVDYAELKPRGHYTSSEDMKTYFKAFKYLTGMAGNTLEPDDPSRLSVGDLSRLSDQVKEKAKSWIAAYDVFITRARSPLIWNGGQTPPPYTRHPDEAPKLFPLSWGMDNEVLLHTVYHSDWPEDERIAGPGGERVIPSGLDVASALGSEFATALLSTQFEEFPPLRKALEDLRVRLEPTRRNIDKEPDLYNRWIAALALQWADEVTSPGGRNDRELWLAKRLQTGLASWATLRHATVLVNERTAAECGEAAFEPILLTPPRGYAEPDPKTFDAIANLFHGMERMVGSWDSLQGEMIHGEGENEGEREALKKGILRRLAETASKASLFKQIAEKEIAGAPLSNQEYEEILNIGRLAEHHFLIFKSLASEENALSNPDPMPKIADVAGGGPAQIPFLMAAVGRPMEWDHVVPYFGRRQIAKGSVYSYYEFVSKELINDEEWRESIASHKHPEWVAPFVSRTLPACPPENPY
ncbi:MAG: DUF3160 domain-containing protein [Syntrophobacteraceae bacterium]